MSRGKYHRWTPHEDAAIAEGAARLRMAKEIAFELSGEEDITESMVVARGRKLGVKWYGRETSKLLGWLGTGVVLMREEITIAGAHIVRWSAAHRSADFDPPAEIMDILMKVGRLQPCDPQRPYYHLVG